jgi:hypothetical protein
MESDSLVSNVSSIQHLILCIFFHIVKQWDWVLSHSVEPVRAIADEIVNDKNLRISDKRAIDDSKESLKVQLRNFYSKRYKDLRPEDVSLLAESMDVRLLSRTFETEMQVIYKGI